MSTFTIPNNTGQIRQDNVSDIFGELWETFNIDLSSTGKIKTSKTLKRILAESTDIGTPAGIQDILIWDGKYFVLTEDNTYECSVNNDPTDSSNWSEVVAIGDLELETTAVIFDGQMRISRGTDISRYNGSGSYATDWWTSDISGTALTDNYPHVLHFHRGGKETLFVTDQNKVRYYNATAGHSTVTLQDDLVACCIDSGVNAIWAGTYNETSGNAYVYEIYVGEQISSVPVARNTYEVDGRAVLALWVKDNIPYIVTERGNIQAFNGAGFTTVAEFPFKFSERTLDGVLPGLIQASSRSRPIHPRGVKTHNDSTYININTESDEDAYAVNTRTHSGVWEFNHKTGQLHHRFAFTHEATDFGSSSTGFGYPLMVADNQFTFLIAGGSDRDTGDDGVYMNTDDTAQGWFITPEITASTVEESYEAIYHKVKTLGASEDIYTLYRTSKRDTVYGTANWLDDSNFTTTADWSNVSVGDLVRVSHGYASGDWAIVKAISSSVSTYSVEVNRAIGVTAGTSYMYSDNFNLLGFDTDSLTYDAVNTYTSDDGEYKRLGVDVTSPWIQYMVIMKGDIEYRQFISKGNSKTEL